MKVRSIMLKSLVLVLALLPLAGTASAQGGGTVVAQGLNGPMGVLVAPDGSVWVIDSGVGGDADLPFVNPETGESITAKFGETSQVVQVAPDGTQTVVANLPSIATGTDNVGGARLALLDGILYATSGQMMGTPEAEAVLPNTAGVVKIEEGQVSEVTSTWNFERSQNPDGHILDSHPYDLIAGPDGNLWVVDAAANDLLKINPVSGEIELVAVFEGLPGPFPNPNRAGAMETDPVPTGVTVGPAGNIYVAFLSGFPFAPGSARVVRVSEDGQVSDYATGLTMLTDLVTGPDGNLYAVQFAQFGEQGPTPNSGKIIRVKEGTSSEVVLSDLSFPTAIDFNDQGDAYVAINGVGAPGSGQVVIFSNLTGQKGSPIPEPAQAMEAPASAETTAPASQAQAAEQPAAAQEAPATLPQSGSPVSAQLWQTGVLVTLGLGLVATGLVLRRTKLARSK